MKCTQKNSAYDGYVKTMAIYEILECPSVFILYLIVKSLNRRLLYNPPIET
jgi:hypothetical protein